MKRNADIGALTEPPMLMLNPFRRSVSIPGKLGAGLVTGTEKVRCGYGNGDCLLLDFNHGIFAVADATERFPQASRILIEQLVTQIDDNGPPGSEPEFDSLLNRAWSHQKFIHKTTLSCVALLHDDGGPAAMLANNGDSSITLLNASDGKTLFGTAVDMNFAGRSRHPNPVSTIRLEPAGATIVLATDGLSDIGDIRATSVARRPDHLAQWIADRMQDASGPTEFDDIGAIALTSDGPATACGTIIMGGTRPVNETGFAADAGRHPALDRWNSFAAWQQSPEIMELAGIRLR